jgi:hypothetical protein
LSKNKYKRILVIKLKILNKKGETKINEDKNEKWNKVKKMNNEKLNQFGESCGLISLTSNLDTGVYD